MLACLSLFSIRRRTIGDTSAMGLHRKVTEIEISDSLGCDSYGSAIAGLSGCSPITSFSQNVSLIAMTGVVNRCTIAIGAYT